jgi:hypothetical protein
VLDAEEVFVDHPLVVFELDQPLGSEADDLKFSVYIVV